MYQNMVTNVFMKKLPGTFNDIGELVDSKFSLISHIERITNKPLKLIGIIFRNLNDFSNTSTCLILLCFYK